MKHMVIKAILYCSPYASLATLKTSKDVFHTVPFQDFVGKQQDCSRRFQEGSRRLVVIRTFLVRTWANKVLISTGNLNVIHVSNQMLPQILPVPIEEVATSDDSKAANLCSKCCTR